MFILDRGRGIGLTFVPVVMVDAIGAQFLAVGPVAGSLPPVVGVVIEAPVLVAPVGLRPA